MVDHLARLARRVQDDPFYLASALAAYARSESLDDAALAAYLGCTPDTLQRLRLCRAPRTDPIGFRADIELVAGRFGVDPTLLADVVRRASALRAFRRDTGIHRGALIAARDHQAPYRASDAQVPPPATESSRQGDAPVEESEESER